MKIGRLKKTLQSFLLSFSLIWKANKVCTLLLVSITSLLSIIPAISILLSKQIIDNLSSGGIKDPEIFTKEVSLTLCLLAIGCLNYVLSSTSQLIQSILKDRLNLTVNKSIFEKASSFDYYLYEDPKLYDVLQRAQQDSSYRPLTLLHQTMALISGVVTFISLLAILIKLNILIVIILLIITLPTLFVQISYSNENFSLQKNRAPDYRLSNYFARLITDIESAKELRLFYLAPVLIKRYEEIQYKFLSQNKQIITRKIKKGTFVQIVSQVGYYALYIYIIFYVIQGIFTIGDLVMFSTAILQAQGSLGIILSSLADLYEQNLFLENYFNFIQLPSSKKPRQYYPITFSDSPPTIEFKHVTFIYPNTTLPALQDVSLTISPNEKIGLVGVNGSGKSTLIKLICGLYIPTSGQITFNGTDITKIDPLVISDKISVIFQDYIHYYLSILDNIGFGAINKINNKEDIYKAAQKSGANTFIKELPNGYETILGRVFNEESVDLSIGQWQKIALARLFIRNSPVLILDEPTASLDVFAEQETYKNLINSSNNKTVLLISHRFSTVMNTERIIVLNHGQIEEEGNHNQLIKLNGLYSKMYYTQAKPYNEKNA